MEDRAPLQYNLGIIPREGIQVRCSRKHADRIAAKLDGWRAIRVGEWLYEFVKRPANGYDTSPDVAEEPLAAWEKELLKKQNTTFKTPRGTHYDTGGVTPVDLIRDAKLNFFEGSVVKYVARHRRKGGKEDLEKAIDYLKMLIESEYPQ